MKRILWILSVVGLILVAGQLVQSQIAAPFRFRIVTWNTGNSVPDCQTVDHLAVASTTGTPEADLLVFGFQEAAKKVFGANNFHKRLTTCLQTRGYVRILSDYVGSDLIKPIWLYMYVRSSASQPQRVHLLDINGAATLRVSPDNFFQNIVGYKGVIAAHVQVDNVTDMIFANMHLPAGEGSGDARCQLWSRFLRTYESTGINHDYLFAFGDQNWRTTKTMSIDEILTAVQEKDYQRIVDNDELTRMRRGESTFMNTRCLTTFQEGYIAFPPTYKYLVETDTYVTRKDRQDRRPSYTDRILVSNLSVDLRLVQYSVMDQIKFSDHRPVFADFLLQRLADAKSYSNKPSRIRPISDVDSDGIGGITKKPSSKSIIMIVIAVTVVVLICLVSFVVIYRFVFKRQSSGDDSPRQSPIELPAR